MEKIVKITHPAGIYARPAAAILKVAKTYYSNITLYANERSADCKGFMDLLFLQLEEGIEVKITTEGKDSEKMMNSICDLLGDNDALDGINPLDKYFGENKK